MSALRAESRSTSLQQVRSSVFIFVFILVFLFVLISSACSSFSGDVLVLINIVALLGPPPITSIWPLLRGDVGLEEAVAVLGRGRVASAPHFLSRPPSFSTDYLLPPPHSALGGPAVPAPQNVLARTATGRRGYQQKRLCAKVL